MILEKTETFIVKRLYLQHQPEVTDTRIIRGERNLHSSRDVIEERNPRGIVKNRFLFLGYLT